MTRTNKASILPYIVIISIITFSIALAGALFSPASAKANHNHFSQSGSSLVADDTDGYGVWIGGDEDDQGDDNDDQGDDADGYGVWIGQSGSSLVADDTDGYGVWIGGDNDDQGDDADGYGVWIG